MVISVQLSLYPLRQAHLSPAIDVVRDVLSAAGLQPAVGPMSTLVTGEADRVFTALHEAFVRAARLGHVVMTLTLSNACPVSGGEPRAVGAL
jgi:uncharacterized protein YqgV (UPF0045/DUF77 family)